MKAVTPACPHIIQFSRVLLVCMDYLPPEIPETCLPSTILIISLSSMERPGAED
jgi:hypothetical protein